MLPDDVNRTKQNEKIETKLGDVIDDIIKEQQANEIEEDPFLEDAIYNLV